LIGGYRGCNSEAPDSSGWSPVLSGDLNLDDGYDFANTSENSYSVLRINRPCEVIGFVIRGGNGNGSPGLYDYGGGAHVWSAGAVLRDCDFAYNRARLGGALTLRRSTVVERCTFRGNQAIEDGGAVAVFQQDAAASVIRKSTFLDNRAAYGGAVHVFDAAPVFFACDFQRNTASYGGGVNVEYSATPEFVRCFFGENVATFDGGAIYNNIGSTTVWSSLRNCLLTKNRARDGAAIHTFDSSRGGADIDNCTIAYNVASREIGGVRIRYQVSMRNSIVYFNTDAGGQSAAAQVGPATSGTIRYSCVQNRQGSGNGNIAVNPGFVSTGNQMLQPASPCRDAGDPATAPLGDELDVYSQPRFRCGRIDIGASEFAPAMFDYDCDKNVGVADAARFLECMAGPGASVPAADCRFADADRDYDLDLLDFRKFIAAFGPG